MCTGSEAGIGSETVFFRFFLDTLTRGERPVVSRRVLTCIFLKGFIKSIIIHNKIFEKQKKTHVCFSVFLLFLLFLCVNAIIITFKNNVCS